MVTLKLELPSGLACFIFMFLPSLSSSRSSHYLEEPQRQPIPPSFLASPSYDQHHTYYPELMSRLYQGDILMAPHDESRNAIRSDTYKWPEGIVPYTFDPEFDNDEEQKKVRDAMDGIEEKTCVKFIPRENQSEYININKEKFAWAYRPVCELYSTSEVPTVSSMDLVLHCPKSEPPCQKLSKMPKCINPHIFGSTMGKGCFAMIGYRPKLGKPLPVNLQSPECLRHKGTIQHELLHCLGLLHEQARPDRDNYVKIMWDNIDPQYRTDFGKAKISEVTTFDVPYDYKSLMHYPKFAFSTNGKDTIVAVGQHLDESIDMGQRDGATDGDLEKVRKMYHCSSTK